MPLLHHQPFKALFLVYFATKTLLVKIPFWTLISLPRSLRPRPNWSIGRCIRIYAIRSTVELPLQIHMLMKRDLSLEVPEDELKNAKFVWVEGVDAESLQGEVREYAQRAGVKPMRIPGYWGSQDTITTAAATAKAKDGEKVVYHLHGGGLFMGSAHPSDATASIRLGIMKHSNTVSRTFAIDYRLSASAPFPAENPFPAALLDCLAGYQYLIGLGFHPKDVIVVGDSAGGNLGLALVRYLTKNPIPDVGVPGKLLLHSPWTDLSSSRTGPTSSSEKNRKSDLFPPLPLTRLGFGGFGVSSYLGTALDREETRTNIYISPGSPHLANTEGEFMSFPKTYVLAGGAERLLDDSTVIAEHLKRDNPVDGWVTLDVAEDMIHDFLMFEWLEPERSDALARVSRWIDQD